MYMLRAAALQEAASATRATEAVVDMCELIQQLYKEGQRVNKH